MSRQGVTLVEVMIATSLLLVVTAACGAALRSAMRYHGRVEQQTHMENSLLNTFALLSRDVSETAPRSILYEPTPASLTFATPRDQAGSLSRDHTMGNTLFFKTLISYRVQSDLSLRRYYEPLPADHALAPHPIDDLTPPRDALYFATPGIDWRRLAEGVQEFTVVPTALDPTTGAESTVSDIAESTYLKVRLHLRFQSGQRSYGVASDLNLVPRN